MSQSIKMPHRGWYFLLCYLAFSSYTFNLMMVEILRPKLEIIFQLDSSHLAYYYQTVLLGMLLGCIIFSFLVNTLNYKTCFLTLWAIQMLGMIKFLALSPIMINVPIIHQLKSGMFLMGIANGGIFAVIHPLIALIFNHPGQSKTKIINFLHTTWPLFFTFTLLFEKILLHFNFSWFWNIYVMLFLSCLYMVVAVFLPLPIQNYAHRIPLSTRLKATIRPGYVLLLFCLISACVTLYGPALILKNWVELDLKIHLFYFLIFLNCVQFFFRFFAGAIAEKITPPGLLLAASFLSVISFLILGLTTNKIYALCSIGVLMISVSCFLPTYIAIVADRYPLSSGLGMGFINATVYFSLLYIIPDFWALADLETHSRVFVNLSKFAMVGFVMMIGVNFAFRSQGGYKVLSNYENSL